MAHTQKVFSLQKETISEDGELLGTESVSVDILVKDSEEFSFVFKKALQGSLNINGAALKVLLWAGSEAALNTNEVSITAEHKQRISDHTAVYRATANGRILVKPGLAVGTIDNAVTDLLKRGLLTRIGKGQKSTLYKVSESFSWRGNMKTRAREMKLNITVRMPENNFPKSDFNKD